MSTERPQPGVLVAVDGSPSAEAAVEWATREAVSRNVPMTLVHVLSPPLLMVWPDVPKPIEFVRWQKGRGAEILLAATNVAREATGDEVRVCTEMPTGPTLPTLIRLSEGADIAVVGCRGRAALARGLLGSVSTGLVRHAHCPVAVVHDDDPVAHRPADAPVVLGIDGSPAAESAIPVAFDAASRRGVELVAVYAIGDADVIDLPGVDPDIFRHQAEGLLAERLAGWHGRYPDVAVRCVVTWAHPVNALVQESERAQLLVVGSHGRGAFAGMLLGSVSSSVAHISRMPVIVTRSR